jgi:hypothetical protein
MDLTGILEKNSIYRPELAMCTDSSVETEVLSLRSFSSKAGEGRLILHPARLELVPARGTCLACRGLSLAEAGKVSAWIRGVIESAAAPYPLHNDGLTRVDKQSGHILTVDLCPSKHPLDRHFFEALPAGTPILLFVAGRWARRHSQDVTWLLDGHRKGRWRLRWGNHSYHHRYDPARPDASNFLLSPETDIQAEVLETERLLLGFGLVISPFFRFPGLVSSKTLIQQIAALGLFPVGAEAWVGKKQTIRPGSVTLLHANGNEPQALSQYLQWSQRHSHLPEGRAMDLGTALTSSN